VEHAMDIFMVKCDVDHYQVLDFVKEDDWDREAKLGLNTGKALAGVWPSFEVEILVDDEEDEELLPSDFPCIGGNIPALSAKAVNCLRALLEEHREILPLQSKKGEYYAYHSTRVVDVLDMKKSNYDTDRNGRIREIKKHVFIPEKFAP
jgi:hypothetical protein